MPPASLLQCYTVGDRADPLLLVGRYQTPSIQSGRHDSNSKMVIGGRAIVGTIASGLLNRAFIIVH